MESDDAGVENVGEDVKFDPVDSESHADYDAVDRSYWYRTTQEKLDAAMIERQKGNDLFREGKYVDAKKAYDSAFVNIFCSKEEWAMLSGEEQSSINAFKAPCHLNRGLVRLKLKELDDALWEFTEALSIDSGNTKGLFRRGCVLIEKCKEEMNKENLKEYWDVDRAQGYLDRARDDLVKACYQAPNDKAIRNEIEELGNVQKQLKEYQKKYKNEQKQLYSQLIANMDAKNDVKNAKSMEKILQNMPPLEPFIVPH
eukprot:CAMPEP_0182450990 /NCGR_PEP_ID=MMETSP1172-20130603/43474_1 /TAXON_ID=708627 /ORGANISM="Timspurckia oligopyrenoides, Strain CCMP3278" /LENGTH=255 /DNA_ID=CAMNT_0024648719 /DNA_START=1501 /DNA_END=2268 /DNA_ORIENTATION=-